MMKINYDDSDGKFEYLNSFREVKEIESNWLELTNLINKFI